VAGSSDRQQLKAAVTGCNDRLQRQAARQLHNQDQLCGIFSESQLLMGAFANSIASSIVREISDSWLC
jgi:hypothetical protein